MVVIFFVKPGNVQVVINYRNKSTGQLSFLVTAMTFGGYLNSRLQQKPVEKAANSLYTLPETNSSPLKMMVSNRNLLFQGSIFRGYVSFRDGISHVSQITSCQDVELTNSSLIFIGLSGSFYDILSWFLDSLKICQKM